jgi:two-component system, sensor histidine kinase
MSMTSFHHWFSIRQKIILIILAVTLLSIITGFTIELFNNIKAARNELTNNTRLDANLISDYLVPTFLFDDVTGARDILQKLANIPTIFYGASYKPDGTIYAEYISPAYRDKIKSMPSDLRLLNDSKHINITKAVVSNKEILGSVLLIASTDIIREKENAHIKSILIILAITILLALFLAFWLERIISGPIRRLATVTKHIQDSLDYSIRVKKEAHDETGLLYDGFNDMLESIESRKRERDLAEAKLEEERASLEVRVMERTRELKMAKEKAEESDNLKSSFLANMSHEIRTPLNAILGCSSLILESSPTPAELEEYYIMMESSGKDLLKLIDDILEISLIEANQVKIELSETNVNDLAEEVFITFKQALLSEKSENHVLPVFIPSKGEEYFLNTDPLRLKQILRNILNNSIKFTQSGSIEFCYYPDTSRSNLEFYIKDTGIGIARDQQERIFERFTKVADIKTKHYRGTGLGLSIALKLTQLLKGKIRVESELDIGTTFYLSFPIASVRMVEAKPEKKIIDSSIAFLSGKVILITEDVENNFKYLEIVLKRNSDIRILWAKTGKEAVAFCEKHPEIDIVLMDIQLPEMNGIEATRIIKSKNRNLPIIAITAYAMPGEETKILAAGCDYYLVKPVNKKLLLDRMEKLLKH